MFHPTMSKKGRIFFYPLIKFCEFLGENYPVTLIYIRYFFRFYRLPNLKNPKDINEKILYLKLYTDTTMWTLLADKFEVRKYVQEKGLSKYLIGLIGKWTNVEDINFSLLPKSFIFKANNGCGKNSNLKIDDVKQVDINRVKHILNEWLNEKHVGVLAAEPQYKNMKPCIIAEELLPNEDGQKSPVDYKIWCFNGKAKYIFVCSDRDENGTDIMLYDLNWNPMPEVCVVDSRYRKGEILPKPQNLDEMIKVAEILTESFPCVRLDLYNIKGQIYFGEMTFTSLGGMMNYFTPKFLRKMGSLVDLEEYFN